MRYPNFRRLYLARTISLMGDWFNLLALLALLRTVVGSPPDVIGGLFIVKLLPTFLAGPIAGVVADRYTRKTIMLVSDIVRFFLVLSFFAVPLFPQYAVPLVYLISILQTSAAAFFEPARSATLPNVVPKEDLTVANALGAITWSGMYAVGAGLGGIVTHLLGWEIALAADAATYLVSAYFVSRLQLEPRIKAAQKMDLLRILGLRDMWEGFVYVRGRTAVAYTMLLKFGWCIGGATQLTLTLYGEQIYNYGGRPDLGTSVLFMARALGTGVGPVIARYLTGDSPQKMHRAILLSFLIGGIFYGLFGLVDHPLPATLFVFTAHIGGSIVWVYSTVLLQRMVPDGFRGRVFAAELGMATLALSVVTYIFGELASQSWFKLPWMPLCLSIIFFCSALAFWLISKRIAHTLIEQSSESAP